MCPPLSFVDIHEKVQKILGSPQHFTSCRFLYIFIYLLTAIGLSPGGSTHLHTNNTQNNTKQTINRTTQQFWKSAARAPSWLVLPWHLPYNRGKSTEKPQSGLTSIFQKNILLSFQG